jgi:hypothetical protein
MFLNKNFDNNVVQIYIFCLYKIKEIVVKVYVSTAQDKPLFVMQTFKFLS